MKRLLLLFTLLFSFQLKAQDKNIELSTDSTNQHVEIICPILNMPSFPGGKESLMTFIKQNNKWKVGRETIVGTVFISFIVEKDGQLTNIEVLKSNHPLCEKEAKRIIGLMPNWKPAEQNGIPIRTKMVLPFFFNGL